MKEKEQEVSLDAVRCVYMAEGCINIGIDAMEKMEKTGDNKGEIAGIAAALFSIAYSMVAMNKMKMKEMETVKAEVEGCEME